MYTILDIIEETMCCWLKIRIFRLWIFNSIIVYVVGMKTFATWH